MPALEVLLALLLFTLCSFASDFFLVRRLRCTPMGKLCRSVGASRLFVYLTFLAAHLLGPIQADVLRAVPMTFSAASLVLIVLARRDILALLHSALPPPNGWRILFPADLDRFAPFPGMDGMRKIEDQWTFWVTISLLILNCRACTSILVCCRCYSYAWRGAEAGKNVAFFTRGIARGGRLSGIKTL